MLTAPPGASGGLDGSAVTGTFPNGGYAEAEAGALVAAPRH